MSGESQQASRILEFRVCEKLRRPISSVSGKAGFQALLSRALKLVKVEFPHLDSIKISADGCLEGLDEIKPRISATETAQIEISLVTNMVELLRTFIGEALTLRLIQDVWPGISFGNSEAGKEKTA